jgi:flavodoxin
MIKVSILYAPDSADNKKAVEEMSSALETDRCAVSVRKAVEAIVADVTGADIVIFGLQKADSSDVQEEFKELARIFKGINLAGKTAAFFSFGQEKAAAGLKKALKSTDISLADPELLLPEKGASRQADVKEWARRVISVHQERLNAGK